MWGFSVRAAGPRLTSSSSSTCLLTRNPAADQCAPQSRRLIVGGAFESEAVVSVAVRATSMVIGFVVPRIVRLPVRVKVVSSIWSILVEVKVMVGWLGASRNLSRRAWSRRGLRVWMLAARIVSWAVDFDGSSPFRWAWPSKVSKWPGTLVAIVWRATKPIRVERCVEDVVAGQFGEVGRGGHAWSLPAEGR